MRRLPVSLQSLVIQCAAVLLAALLFWLLENLVALQIAMWQFALAQGFIAALFSRVLGQPAWWPPLHFLFLPLVILARQSALPDWLYLDAFATLLVFYWNTFRTRVPLYLSDRKAWQALADLLPKDRPFRFIDVGSGLGGVPLHLESRFPQGHFFGTEIAPAPWLISRARAAWRQSRVTFMRRDYATLNLGDYDVVFAFLSPAAMPSLWVQAQQQMRTGSLFVSLSFALAEHPPDQSISLADGERHTLHVWRMKTAK